MAGVDTRPGDGLTTRQLLDALGNRIASILSVDFSPTAWVTKLISHQPVKTY